MPSAITKQPLESGASLPQETSIQAALAIVEKKVRNLEKRKGKLDSYRDILSSGKALDEDQQSAVDKYDEVIGTLEFTKELMGQFSKLATDEAKDKKKIMRKELQEKSRDELSKVTYVLALKEILYSLKNERVLDDLKTGAGGAPKLSREQLAQLQQFGELVNPWGELRDKGNFDKQVNISAEHLIQLAEMKNKSVAGTTYHDLNNLISNIRESGYLEGRWTKDQSPAGGNDPQDGPVENEEEDVDQANDNGTETNGHNIEENNKMLGQTSVIEAEEAPATQPSQGTTESVPAPTQVKQEAGPSFNFLQESQIDLESPHMDPAVVMVHPAKKPVQPPGMTGQQADKARQMMHHLHLQQQQHQVLLEETKLSTGQNAAFDGPIVANGVSSQSSNPPFPQSKEISAPGTDPRAPRVPDGTPQHLDASPAKTSPPSSRLAYHQSGYAAAAGGANNKIPDNEIGTWKPEGMDEEDEENRGYNGERKRGRGGGRGGVPGRGNRGYSRGRGGGSDRGGYRGGRGGGERKFDDKREDRYRGSARGGGFRGGRDRENGRGGPRGGYNGFRD